MLQFSQKEHRVYAGRSM
uniref:Uncharacterized protein n=1 Tax=Arundo donax TaxID=35708 RepID=A0A0A9B8J6_ARUDO